MGVACPHRDLRIQSEGTNSDRAVRQLLLYAMPHSARGARECDVGRQVRGERSNRDGEAQHDVRHRAATKASASGSQAARCNTESGMKRTMSEKPK